MTVRFAPASQTTMKGHVGNYCHGEPMRLVVRRSIDRRLCANSGPSARSDKALPKSGKQTVAVARTISFIQCVEGV